MRPGVTVQNAPDPCLRRLANHRSSVCLRISRVNHHRKTHLASEPQLLGKNASLLDAWRIVIMVVESAFADRHSSFGCDQPESLNITRRVESDRIVRMNASGEPDIPRIRGRYIPRRASGAENISGAAA
jgi:hypothetical protein